MTFPQYTNRVARSYRSRRLAFLQYWATKWSSVNNFTYIVSYYNAETYFKLQRNIDGD